MRVARPMPAGAPLGGSRRFGWRPDLALIHLPARW